MTSPLGKGATDFPPGASSGWLPSPNPRQSQNYFDASEYPFDTHPPTSQPLLSARNSFASILRPKTYGFGYLPFTDTPEQDNGRSPPSTESIWSSGGAYGSGDVERRGRRVRPKNHPLMSMMDCVGDPQSPYQRAKLVDNNGGQYERLRKSPEEIKGIKHRDVRGFYERQNMLLDSFEEVDTLLDSVPRRAPETNGETTSLLPQYHPTENTRDAKDARFVRWTIHVNLIINIILFLGKLSVVLISSSISLLASATDSGMDLLSTLILFWASWTISSNDWRRKWMFPVGLRRAEPMGVVVFSVFMISSFVQVSIESCKRLLSNDAEVVALPLEGVIIMVITIVVKFGVWQSSQGSKSSTIRALSQDAENDVFFNTVSLLFPFIGHKLGIWWLDPLGGVALSLYIIVEWIETLRSNIRNLMGVKASADEYQRVAYLIMRFSPCIDAVQHLDVYSSGDQFMVEADLVLPADTTFPMAHYIGESVQYAIESLSGIERAYCHIDYNSNNPSGHLVR